MTRQELRDKLYNLEAERYDDLKTFTKHFWSGCITPFMKPTFSNEKDWLVTVSHEAYKIQQVMRQDIPDFDCLTKIRHYLSRRLKTIENE